MRYPSSGVCLAVVALIALASAPGRASASVVQHVVTPRSDASLPGIDVRVSQRPDGDLVFTLTVSPARLPVQPPRLIARPGAEPSSVAWRDADADPRVAQVVVPRAQIGDAEITVMRDFGLVGHFYRIPVRAWAAARR